MQRVYAEVERLRDAVRTHKLFIDIQTLSSDDIVEKVKNWAPLFAPFTMIFRDINRLYYQYPCPANAFEEAINAHAQVDATHWTMLAEDLERLGVRTGDGSYGSAMRLMWSDIGAPFRDYMYWMAHRAQVCGDSPFLRASVMEAAETTSRLFFGVTRHIAHLFKQATGSTLRYFGDEHVQLDVDTAMDVSVLKNVALDEETTRLALSLIREHFAHFERFIDYQHTLLCGDGMHA
ncbi:MAG: hypothetical protein ACU84J_09090 [Gammaproteobacteria bacterium]